MENKLSHYGSIAGSVAAILGLLWLIGEPHLKTYINDNIEQYDIEQKEANSKKVKLRTLLSTKMGVADDEVHIELGKQYKNEKKLHFKLDSLGSEIEFLRKEIDLNLESIKLNYRDIQSLQTSVQNLSY